MNKRRKIIFALGAGVLATPFASFAQPQGKVWRVGFLAGRHVDFVDSDIIYGPFRQGLRELGLVEGKHFVIEWRSSEGSNERLPGLATELVNLKVDVIVVAGTPAVRAAQNATAVIPIVMGSISDPVGSGFVKSLARPAGNITGLSSMSGDVNLKQLEMLIEMVPRLSRLAVLVHPLNIAAIKYLEMVQAEAQRRGMTFLRAEARTPQEIDDALSQLRQQNAGALIVLNDQFFTQQNKQVAELTLKHRLPCITGDRIFVEAGVLMSYAPNLAAQYRRAATYVDKILKGAKAGDIPVEQPTKFELFINRKTAQALGLTIAQSLLISADKVIE